VKTQIVNIDPHDDYGSIRDKLLWTKALRVILVWPGRGDVLTSHLDLVLLKRLGQQENIALGFLTFDPRVIAHAIDLSIPVFENLENIPESSWDLWKPDKEVPTAEHQQHDINRPKRTPEVTYRSLHSLSLLYSCCPLLIFPCTL
jgi:hypothetical protein